MTTSDRPGKRVTVVHPRTAAARTAPRRGVRRDLRDQTELGVTMLTSLRRAQLRLATLVIIGVAAVVVGIPLVFLAFPAVREGRIGGLAVGWFVLGVAVFPAICSAAWFFVRHAERNEAAFIELVERS